MVCPGNRDFLENLVFQENQDRRDLLGTGANREPREYRDWENRVKTDSVVNLGTPAGKENQDLQDYQALRGCRDTGNLGFQDPKDTRDTRVFLDPQDQGEIKVMAECRGSLVPLG